MVFTCFFRNSLQVLILSLCLIHLFLILRRFIRLTLQLLILAFRFGSRRRSCGFTFLINMRIIFASSGFIYSSDNNSRSIAYRQISTVRYGCLP